MDKLLARRFQILITHDFSFKKSEKQDILLDFLVMPSLNERNLSIECYC
jgi:hypothetical protein